MTTLSVVIAVRDEERMLPGCLRRLTFADEVVVLVDDRTTDRSAELAREAGAHVVHHQFTTFADLKNAALDAATGDWLLALDADERVSRALASEVTTATGRRLDAYRIRRANYFYGQLMRYGGWQDRPIRLVRRGWGRFVGDIHEVLKPVGTHAGIGELSEPLVHFSHRSVLDNLVKTATFSDVHARSLLANGSPPVTSRRLYVAVAAELLHRLVLRRAWRDGVPGVIEALYQPLSALSVQARLWELQQHPSIATRYEQLEEEIP
jgi:glycosyltransferase involved in cell wall biosynthesis